MISSHTLRRLFGAVVALGLVAVLVGACGSGSGTSSTPGTSSGTTPSASGLPHSGPGLTEPTTGSGTRVKGGTVTYAEQTGAPPNYIFPLYPIQDCTTANVLQLNMLMYRPLYWFGNNYRSTVDYKDSIGQKPVFSGGGKVVTIHLNHYKWSDGETVSARDLEFWMNLLTLNPAKDWCSYVPGKFPQNVVSYKVVNPTTFQMTLNRAYNPTWFLYNELSQVTPIPIAWDRTSLSQKAPSPNASNLPDMTKSGAGGVYNFLNAQSLKLDDWSSSPLWSVVDGPWKVHSTTTSGEVSFVPNTAYSGPTKPSIAKFEEVPFTSQSAMLDELKAQGTNALTVAYLPSQYQPLSAQLEAQGYDVNKASSYSVNFFPLNLQNPTVGPIFRQLYFRQAFQHLVDQDGWIRSFLHGTAVATYGPVPSTPPNPLVSTGSSANPYPFSVSDASKLLKANGWKVVPGGESVCAKPGSASGDCGAGVKKGQPIAFTLDYESGVTAVQEEMQDLQSQASKVGIKISLTEHPVEDVAAAAAHCTAGSPKCNWEAENWGAGEVYAAGNVLPSGESLFVKGAISNYSNYFDPKMEQLVNNTLVGPAGAESANMQKFARFAEQNLPVVFQPTSIGTFGASAGTLIDKKLGGYTANSIGALTPEDWYLTK
jgi:peptide/nickel transport system substrate-binding protein